MTTVSIVFPNRDAIRIKSFDQAPASINGKMVKNKDVCNRWVTSAASYKK